MSLKGKVALITGSTSGIGLGIAKELAKQGAALMLNGIVPPGQEEWIAGLQRTLSAEYSVPVKFSPANVAKPEEVSEMIAATIRELGSLDILVNNAGIQHVAPLEEFPLEKWDDILAVNLSSVFFSSRAVLPEMKRKGWGRIVNIASVHGMVASAHKSAYVAAKHGVIGLTKVTALETAQTGITCNAICPGWVLTPLVQKQIEDLAQKANISEDEAGKRLLAEKQPSQAFVTTEQIGGAVAFLCSEAASQMRGATLQMDGGWLGQ